MLKEVLILNGSMAFVCKSYEDAKQTLHDCDANDSTAVIDLWSIRGYIVLIAEIAMNYARAYGNDWYMQDFKNNYRDNLINFWDEDWWYNN